MTIQRRFFEWSKSGLDWSKPPYEACSPNLLALRAHLDATWPGGQYLGCQGNRDIRAGGTVSTHSYGAAFDWRYPDASANAVIVFLIANSAELGVDAIHDYLRSRIWHAGRTPDLGDAYTAWWRPQTPSTVNGMGQAWANYLHIETHPDAFTTSTPISPRLAPPPPILEEDDMTAIAAIYEPDATVRAARPNPKYFVLRGDGGIRHASGSDVEYANRVGAPTLPIRALEHYDQLDIDSRQGLSV